MEQVQAYTEEELAKMDWAFEKSGGPSEELFTHVEYSVLGTTVSQETLDTLKAARAIALDNAPAGTPTMFLRGKDEPEYIQFFCISEVSDANDIYLPVPAAIGVTLDESRFVTPIVSPDQVYDFIRYDVIQYLAAEQKKRARINIDVLSPEELINDVDFISTFAAVRYVVQRPTAAQQMQVYTNLGLKVYITNSSILGTTVSAEVGASLRSAKILLFADTSETFFLGSESPNRFYSFFNSGYIREISVTDANVVSAVTSRSYVDNLALHFNVQSLTDEQKAQARINIDVLSPEELINDESFITQLKTKLGI